MCCNGSAHWKREEVPDHKFDFIDVQEYRNTGFLTRFKYGFFWLMVVKSFAVYVADIYTAITLLAFGHFSGNIYEKVQDDPDNNFRVPISYGKWIFTGCIIFSFLLLAYEAHKSRAIVKSRDISYAFTNVMANSYYSCRSYNHFCLFCQINNSKKKKDEFAFFIFFTFKGWKRLLVADGPRQVINFFTLYGLGSLANWSTDPYDYYEGSWVTALMILTMLFTVVVFAGSLLLLIIAGIMYIPLLCYIKGNLKEYCCHKIDKRISDMVKYKKKQRLMKQAAIARKEAAGDFSHLMNKKGEMVGRAIPQPTLPNVDIDLLDEKPGAPLQRTNSGASSTVVHGSGTGYYNDKGAYASPSVAARRFFYGGAAAAGNDYSSTANLMKNAGPAGGESVAGAPSLPPGSIVSPEVGAAHVRGIEPLLDQMGPIGTSPQLFAQRVGGQGRLSPQPGMHEHIYGSQAGARTLLDPQSGNLLRSPSMGDPRSGTGPFNPEAPNQAIDNPYANGGLDYPPPKNVHGVEGLEFPPPQAPSDLSSFVPYYDRTTNGDSGEHGYDQPPSIAFEAASSTLHDHGTGPSVVDGNRDPYRQHYQQQPHYGHNGTVLRPGGSPFDGAGNGAPSPDPSTGGYEDVYDAYITSQNASQSATPDRRNSAVVMAVADDQTAYNADWQPQSYAESGTGYGASGDSLQDRQQGWNRGQDYGQYGDTGQPPAEAQHQQSYQPYYQQQYDEQYRQQGAYPQYAAPTYAERYGHAVSEHADAHVARHAGSHQRQY